ncbi:ketoacyl-ACP synthase III [Campylobacter sp. 19-13652]|uniref:ketoacyl-ACP synthase III n=1 Tax=Campylobacter sp. 19-13652 TaxID=2840180 RepID=UPI001C78894B|nr:ketoacyl-ACP synthase III [Campylobacter sp. 19-13652]BCX79194.1 3-oxoacyl-ACP synthase [Campylobacter sp. 19-13652]
MAKAHIKNVKISAVCCAVPKDRLSYEDFYAKIDKDTVDRFVKEAGVKQKFYSKDKTTIASDLCCAAAEEIFSKKGIDKSSIDALVLVTQSPDYPSPATSNTLQYRLGLNEDCLAYDVNLGCSGYVYGLYLAASHISSGAAKRVLLLAGDTNGGFGVASGLNELLFGDCGSATIIEYTDELEYADGFRFILKTMGSGFKALGAVSGLRYACVDNPEVRPEIYMDGLSVFSFSITKVPALFREFFESFGGGVDDYDSVLLHQANKSIIDMISKKIKAKNVPICLDRYANTASATVANVMCDHYAKTVMGGGSDESLKMVKIIMSGFGVGLSLAIADTHVDTKNILPIIHTNLTWDEGRQKVLNAK